MLSKRVLGLNPSATIAVSQKAAQLKAQGYDILNFSAGEPDFDTPQIIKDAASKALKEGYTKYTSADGIAELKEAIAQKLLRDDKLSYDLDQIIVSNGAKHSLFNVFASLIDHGDEVIIPAPFWVTYPEVVSFFGGQNVIIDTDETHDFKITPEQLKNALTSKTKILILNTPSNPTGAIYNRAELEALYDVLKGTNVFVVSDEIYEKLIYNGSFTAAASINADAYERTITINGMSKSVAMTGWRVGYAACANKELAQAIKKLQSQATSNINSIAQKAAIVACGAKIETDINIMRETFKKRRDLAVEAISCIEKLSTFKPQGAFYLFINIMQCQDDSIDFCTRLLEQEALAIVAGIGFGSEGYVRFSFATSEENITNGIKRLKCFVENNF